MLTFPDDVQRVTAADKARAREMLGISLLEATLLLGVLPDGGLPQTGVDSTKPIPDPSLSLQVRQIIAFPQLVVPGKMMPLMPTAKETFEHIQLVTRNPGFSVRQFGLQCGSTGQVAAEWVKRGMPPATVVRHLHWILKGLLDLHGEEGWASFQRLVDIEYRVRHGVGLDQLLSAKTSGWYISQTREADKKLGELPPLRFGDDPQRITGRDIGLLRERLGLSLLDMGFLAGTLPGGRVRVTGTKSLTPLIDPTLCLVFRILLVHPELTSHLLPKFPSTEEFYKRLAAFFPEGLTKRQFSRLVGSNDWAAAHWFKSGVRPVTATTRLMWTLDWVLREYGKTGLDRYLTLVEAEYRARDGVSLDELLHGNRTGWKIRSKDSKGEGDEEEGDEENEG